MKPWQIAALVVGTVLLILIAIPQTRCTLTGGTWLNVRGTEWCYR